MRLMILRNRHDYSWRYRNLWMQRRNCSCRHDTLIRPASGSNEWKAYCQQAEEGVKRSNGTRMIRIWPFVLVFYYREDGWNSCRCSYSRCVIEMNHWKHSSLDTGALHLIGLYSTVWSDWLGYADCSDGLDFMLCGGELALRVAVIGWALRLQRLVRWRTWHTWSIGIGIGKRSQTLLDFKPRFWHHKNPSFPSIPFLGFFVTFFHWRRQTLHHSPSIQRPWTADAG
jgi:hypothetical protein